METTKTPTKTPNNLPAQEAKPPVIPKAVKNFFFYGLKKSPRVKKVAKAYGEVIQIAYMIAPPKNKRTMRVICKNKDKEIKEPVINDVDFSEEELDQLLKVINKTRENVQLCKSIFVLLDMKNKCVSYQHETKDGETINFTI